MTIRSVRTTLALAASALIAGSALAAPFQLDDSGFGYASADSAQTAYLDLVETDAGLTLVLSSSALNSFLPTIEIANVPDIEGEDMFGDDLLADVSNLDEIALDAAGNAYEGFTVTHEGAGVAAATDAYTAEFESLGFALISSERNSQSSVTLEFGRGDDAYRAFLRGSGSGVIARVTAL